MDCNEVSDLLSAYLDGELDQKEAQIVTNHLKFCSLCSKELSELRQTIDLLHELPDLSPPADFCLQVMNKIRTEPRKPIWLKIKAREWFSFGAIAAAILLFIVSANSLSPFKTLPGSMEQSQEMGAESSAAPAEPEPATDQLSENFAVETVDEASSGAGVSSEGTVFESEEYQESSIASSKSNSKVKANNVGAQKSQEGNKQTTKNTLDSSTASKELDISLQDYNSNGDKSLKNRSTDYRGREEAVTLMSETREVVLNGLDYTVVLYSENEEQVGQEISQIVYALGGNVLSDEADYLELAVPTPSLKTAMAAINDQGLAEVQQVSSDDLNQTIKCLQTKQESLLLKIKELERQILEVSSEKSIGLKEKITEYYSDLKTTQLRLKNIANGKAIVKIYLEHLKK